MSTDSEHGGQEPPATDGGAADMDLASVRPRVVHDLQLHELTICSCPPGTPGHYPITLATAGGVLETFRADLHLDLPEESDDHDRPAAD